MRLGVEWSNLISLHSTTIAWYNQYVHISHITQCHVCVDTGPELVKLLVRLATLEHSSIHIHL